MINLIERLTVNYLTKHDNVYSSGNPILAEVRHKKKNNNNKKTSEALFIPIYTNGYPW